MIHFRGSKLLYFLAFLKNQLFNLLHVISKQFTNIRQGFPNHGILAPEYLKLLKKACAVLGNYSCSAAPQVTSQG